MMFKFFFKYSPIVYQEGHWSFHHLPALQWLLLMVLALALLTILLYRKQVMPISRFLRIVLTSLKILGLLLLLLCFLEPYISVTTIVPKKSSVLLLIDDSASMGIHDGKRGEARIDQVKAWLGDAKNPGLMPQLKTNFNVMEYRFGNNVHHLNSPRELSAGSEATDLARALQFAGAQLENHPISAVILVTDGVQASKSSAIQEAPGRTPATDPLQAAAALGDAGLPVYTVGVGSQIQNDVQLAKVNVKRSVMEDDIAEMSALIYAKQANGKKVTLQLLEEDRVIQSREVTLSNKYTRVSMSFKPTRKGYLKYTAVVLPLAGELITSNNEKSFLVNNEQRLARILYIEELHPSEFKFLRRALDMDKSLQLVSMVRTGPEKFYRQGISNPGELAGGFPDQARDLFKYQAIMIGSIEASFFSPKQIQLIKDFVSKRGGGLLMLGGPKSFSQGGWDKTDLAEVLPVELLSEGNAGNAGAEIRYAPFKLQLTPEGLRSPILQLALNPKENQQKWASMPELQSYNPLGRARPGATILAVHPLSQSGREKIIIAEQKYGRGRSMVIATSTTWRWQMRLPSTDMRHERFWRQVGRWLAFSSPEPVEVTLNKETYLPGEKIPIQISVLDSNFLPVENAVINAELTLPGSDMVRMKEKASDGDPPAANVQTIDILPDLKKEGRYKGTYLPDKEGVFEIEILAHDAKGNYLGRAETAFLVQKENIEYAKPDLDAPLLQRIAEVTDGHYVHIDRAQDLADQLSVAKSSYAKVVERDIWDVPALYGLIILLLAIEWYTRRSKGLS